MRQHLKQNPSNPVCTANEKFRELFLAAHQSRKVPFLYHPLECNQLPLLSPILQRAPAPFFTIIKEKKKKPQYQPTPSAEKHTSFGLY